MSLYNVEENGLVLSIEVFAGFTLMLGMSIIKLYVYNQHRCILT